MSNKLRLFLVILATLLVANVTWQWWANRGRVTIDANDQAVTEVVRSLQRQGGIRIVSNVPADAKITMHVRKVPLLHALEVLAANAGASWRVAYFTAPDKGVIEAALGTLAGGTDPEGWKRWSMPPMGGMGDEGGATDPRLEEWQPKPASEGNLHAYLGQAANVLSARFWAPEQWNPAVRTLPKAGRITNVLPKLANAAGGKSVEVFLLRARRATGDIARGGPPADAQPAGDGPRFEFRAPSEETRKATEERMNAQIERLPKAKQAEARGRMEEGRKMFEEMAKLSPEERRAKMEENMDKMMSNSDPAMSAIGTQRGAMQTAEQRAESHRDYLDKKRAMNQ